MNARQFNATCRRLPATSHVVQWGGADVWKVGGKVFAIGSGGGGRADRGEVAVTFKVSALAFEILKDQPGLRPAPYLASRGLSWIQHHARPGLSDAELKEYLARSHALVAAGLPKRKRRDLGLDSA